MARATLEDLLKTSKTRLFLCSKGGKLDLTKEKLRWRMEGMFAEFEREVMVTPRTESGWVTSRLVRGPRSSPAP